ncbi:SMI1/KNR4 family protein [Streptomyces sp. ME19-01-6]|uniref:SMI1/KNR4 family protein n=1 Tax=Streptomyces sp. ME19-01-6 TaxID=3028686 RepID=UPI0029BAD075|nr:SMI1/KNR4 family protein [Streptomyces sp. ME19-01-6]MDX3231508.1 SMI1/KNR4 family protein [Streptomyces sp. ME19-01-6]
MTSPQNPQNPQITALLQQVAHSMAKGAPPGWQRASISARADRHAIGCHGVVNVLANGRTRPGSMRTPKQLKRVFELDDTGADALAIELMVFADGRFEALTSRAIALQPQGPGHVYVLRPDVRPPDPGDLQSGPVDPTQAGDPQEAVRLLWAYLRKRTEIFGWEPGRLERFEDVLPGPWNAEEIEDYERKLGVPLPDDLRALYAVADGDGGDDGSRLFDRHIWLDLDQLVSFRHADHWWAAGDTWQYHRLGSVRSDGLPRATVRSSADRPGWIVFADSTGGDFLAVDMDPAEGGRPGQVIRVGLHHDDGPVYVADSVTELLRLELAALERGDYRCDAASEQLWIDAGLRELPGDTAEDADGGTEGSGAAAEPPVHHADVTCDAELSPLAGDPTLAAVTVRSAEPVSLAPLRDCPRLYGLDLSRAAVRDLEVAALIPGLRYLAMRPEQWRDLIERAGPPPALAAAVLADASSPETLAEWAVGLGGDRDDIRYYTGRLPDHT